MTSKVKLSSPTKAQVELVVLAIDAWPESTLVAWMEGDGTMMLSHEEDGLTTYGRFDSHGQIVGHWF